MEFQQIHFFKFQESILEYIFKGVPNFKEVIKKKKTKKNQKINALSIGKETFAKKHWQSL